MPFRCYFRSKTLNALLLALLLTNCAPNVFAQDGTSSDADAAEAVKLFERGQEAHARGDLQTALASYEASLKLRAEFPEAEYQRGAALVSLKRLPEAEEAFRRALELHPDWELPLVSLGALLERSNRPAEAEQLLNRALQLDNTNAAALLALTNLYLRQTPPAPAALEKLLERLRNATTTAATTNSAQAASLWTARGSVEKILKDEKSALVSFNRAVALDPNNAATARLLRADLRAASGDIAGALEDINTAQSDARFNASNAQTIAALQEKIFAQAINDANGRAALEKMLAQDSRAASLYARLGEFYRATDPARALQLFRRAAELEPRNASYATGYAAALVQARRFAEARDILRRVLSLAPANADSYAAHANLATALYELKSYAEALPEYEWITRAKPDLAVTYFFIGSAHDFLNELPEALAAYEKFLAHADTQTNQLEIDKVNLRLPTLRNQIKQGVGAKKRKASG